VDEESSQTAWKDGLIEQLSRQIPREIPQTNIRRSSEEFLNSSVPVEAMLKL
jgi:hypothetical protein